MNDGEAHERKGWIRDALARFEGRLLRYAIRLTGNAESGRDVVQETFLKLCDQEPEQIDGHLEPWLFTVCRRGAINLAQRENRMSTITDSSNPDQSALEPAVDAPPELALGERETNAQLQKLLGQLSTNKQEVIRLKFQEDLSYRQISEVTGLSVSNVGYLLHTALAELRAQMEREG